MAGGGYDTLFDSNIITAGESRRPGHDDKALPDHPGRRPRAGDGEGEAALRRASDTLATVSSGAAAGSGVPAGTDIRLRTATDAVARVGAPRAGQVHDESRPRRSFDGFCTAPEAAARLGISRAGIGHLVRSGRLKAIKDKGIWLIPTEEVEAYHPSSRRRHNRTDILVLIRPRDGEWPCGTPEHGLIQELGRPSIMGAWVTTAHAFAALKFADPAGTRHAVDRAGARGILALSWTSFQNWHREHLVALDMPQGHPSPLIDRLRSGAPVVWRLKCPWPMALRPFLSDLARPRRLRYAVPHAVIAGRHGYIDVQFDGDEAAVAALRRDMALWGIDSASSHIRLAGQPDTAIWCDDIRADIREVVRWSLEEGGQRFGRDEALIDALCRIAEAGYPDYSGGEPCWYWLAPDRLKTALGGRPGRIGVKQLQRAVRSFVSGHWFFSGVHGFARVLAEFHALALLADRCGWSPAALTARLPHLIRADLLRLDAAGPPQCPSGIAGTLRHRPSLADEGGSGVRFDGVALPDPHCEQKSLQRLPCPR